MNFNIKVLSINADYIMDNFESSGNDSATQIVLFRMIWNFSILVLAAERDTELSNYVLYY